MDIYREILEEELTRRTATNPNYSLRAFANNIGINHGALSQILSGKRIPSYKMMQKILIELDLEQSEEDSFIQSLLEAYKEKNLKRINPQFKNLISKIPNEAEYKNIEQEKFKIMADWYHSAIFVLLQKDEVSCNPELIAKKLKISKFQVLSAFERLESLGFLDKTENGYQSKNFSLKTNNKDITSLAHKKRQRQILEKSIEALDKHDMAKRSHTAMTMAIDPQKLPEAKKKILNFMRELTNYMEEGQKKEVYELSVSFFSLEN
jgi:uncharacterized protein (TIGR02147 family)